MGKETIIRKEEPLPLLETLYERHIGLYEPLCRAYAGAASVCFSRYYSSPTDLSIDTNNGICVRKIQWEIPNESMLRSWANTDDAIRDAAYSVSLSIIEVEYGLFAIARAETKTGADYYVAPLGDKDLEGAYRLEVSGTNQGDLSTIRSRLKEKTSQIRSGNSSRPGIVSIVGFKERFSNIKRVDD